MQEVVVPVVGISARRSKNYLSSELVDNLLYRTSVRLAVIRIILINVSVVVDGYIVLRPVGYFRCVPSVDVLILHAFICHRGGNVPILGRISKFLDCPIRKIYAPYVCCRAIFCPNITSVIRMIPFTTDRIRLLAGRKYFDAIVDASP